MQRVNCLELVRLIVIVHVLVPELTVVLLCVQSFVEIVDQFRQQQALYVCSGLLRFAAIANASIQLLHLLIISEFPLLLSKAKDMRVTSRIHEK